MTHLLCSLALLAGATNARPDALPGFDGPGRTEHAATRPASAGYLAEIEVSLGGVTRQGRVVVHRDGSVHLEHLDEQTARWVQAILRPDGPPSNGWDDRRLRAGPVRHVWGRLGEHALPVEIHTPDATLKLSRHQLLTRR